MTDPVSHIGPAWGVTEDDPETPPAIPTKFRPTIVTGMFLTGTATGWALAHALPTILGGTT